MFFKDKKEKMAVWEWGENRTIQRISMDVDTAVVLHPKKPRAHHLIHDFTMRDHVYGGLALLVWQRDSFPKHPFRNIDAFLKSQLEDINQIAKDRAKSAKDKALDDAQRNRLAIMFTMLGYVFGIAVLLAIIYMVIQNGGLENLKFW